MGVTAPTLPDTLARLAELLPSRVRLGKLYRDGVQTIEAFDATATVLGMRSKGAWTHIGTLRPSHEAGDTVFPPALRDLREALEQEIESRLGWDWAAGTVPCVSGRYDATVWTGGPWRESTHVAHADTPAHALALALLAALEGGASP